MRSTTLSRERGVALEGDRSVDPGARRLEPGFELEWFQIDAMPGDELVESLVAGEFIDVPTEGLEALLLPGHLAAKVRLGGEGVNLLLPKHQQTARGGAEGEDQNR
jgi:hypothetical protein